jgi:cell wall-associated NlpC family hydrolase
MFTNSISIGGLFKGILKVAFLLILLSSCASKKVVKKKTYPTKRPVAVKPKVITPTPTPKKVVIAKPNVAAKALKIDEIIVKAKTYLGTPHVMGGMTKKGIDCSGLIINSYNSIGITVPRVSRDQANTGIAVPFNKLEKGDLVFFHLPGATRITHVGMVSKVEGGNVTFIHTSSSKGVREDNLFSNYWKPLLVKARRILE